jgi:hypothetical protein
MLSSSSDGEGNLSSQTGMLFENADEERPRKRARSGSPALDVMMSIEHDPEYYFEDGSTIVRVQNILFKVDFSTSGCSSY